MPRLKNEISNLPLDTVLRMLERGWIGHSAAMEYLKIDSLTELVDVMHDNGRQMPGHRPMRLSAETVELLVAAIGGRPDSDESAAE